MTDKSQEPNTPPPSKDSQSAEQGKRGGAAMLPAGPHSEPHLTNPDATPGTGSLPAPDHEGVETDPGGG
jgi:hypothetical protein